MMIFFDAYAEANCCWTFMIMKRSRLWTKPNSLPQYDPGSLREWPARSSSAGLENASSLNDQHWKMRSAMCLSQARTW